MERVFVDHHLNEFITHDKGQNSARYGKNDVIRQRFDHPKDTAAPCLGRGAHCASDFRYLSVDAVEQPVQIAHDPGDEHIFDPLDHLVPEEVHQDLPPCREAPAEAGAGIIR